MVFKKFFKILRRALKLKRKSRRKRRSRPRKKSHQKPKRKSIVRRKASRRRPLKTRKKKAGFKKPQPKVLGVITHYFPKVKAAVVKLKKPLSIGEAIWIKGKSTDFRQTVGSLQIDRKPIIKARAGQEIGLEVFREVRPGDMIYLSR